jgi:hypothetical protein
MTNWLNDISRDINENLRERRSRLPSIVQRHKWHNEFVELGLDKRMSFAAYLKTKTKEWRKSKQIRRGKKTTKKA